MNEKIEAQLIRISLPDYVRDELQRLRFAYNHGRIQWESDPSNIAWWIAIDENTNPLNNFKWDVFLCHGSKTVERKSFLDTESTTLLAYVKRCLMRAQIGE